MQVIDKMRHADRLISLQNTGNLREFSEKLTMSIVEVQELLDVMMAFHAPIIFDADLNSYTYETPGEFQIGFIRY